MKDFLIPTFCGLLCLGSGVAIGRFQNHATVAEARQSIVSATEAVREAKKRCFLPYSEKFDRLW